ncbi:hypothetical protein [Mycoplasma procyoni]|uniref:hypothetical protein n=1 Tax=Mycoplasma procyoni TaxID=568784 RepID=UPI00197B40D1|nr:hypothetical protein [Mycoplasma procyoni]MBN3534943.1 hypothetical protein [Mycoplasma procyoni]
MKFKKNKTNQKPFKTKFEKIKDSRLVWISVFLINLAFLVFSIVKIPVLSTIHSYTIGLFFGVFSYVYFGLIFIISFIKITHLNFLKTKWYRITMIDLAIISMLIVFLVEFSLNIDSINYKWGFSAMQEQFSRFWETFKSTKDAMLPNDFHFGAAIIFCVSLLISLATNLGALIILALALLIYITVVVILSKKHYVLVISSNKRLKKTNKNKKIEQTQNTDQKENDQVAVVTQQEIVEHQNNQQKNQQTENTTQEPSFLESKNSVVKTQETDENTENTVFSNNTTEVSINFTDIKNEQEEIDYSATLPFENPFED